MSRRTFDLIFSAGAAVLAVMILILGFVLADQGSFADTYVKDQLGQQKITFAAADKLTDGEKSWKPGSSCLSAHAGKLMETGKQAECYANYFIGFHLEEGRDKAGYPGSTYATLGGIQTSLRAEVAEAKSKSDTTAAEASQKKLDAVTSLRGTAQTGETLRGLLLTSYGFSIFGEKASLAGTVCFIMAALLIIVAAAGFVHAFRTPAPRPANLPATAPYVTAPAPIAPR